MGVQTHWEKIYAEKAPKAVSWYRPHTLRRPIALIEQTASGRSASVINVGGGESTLVDDLLARKYENITVLDIYQTAIDANRKRLGRTAERVHWLVADIIQVELESSAYDVWHDRAVFHFLTAAADRLAYIHRVANAVKRGGNVIVSTFGPEGPTRCSGLDVVRYDAESLHRAFGVHFRMFGSSTYTGRRLGCGDRSVNAWGDLLNNSAFHQAGHEFAHVHVFRIQLGFAQAPHRRPAPGSELQEYRHGHRCKHGAGTGVTRSARMPSLLLFGLTCANPSPRVTLQPGSAMN
jgi:Methyltransferase domain